MRALPLALLVLACAREPAVDLTRPALMPCGPTRQCDARGEYCESINTDVPALPSTYTCKPLPDACMPARDARAPCGCFAPGTRCKSFCRRVPTSTPRLVGFDLVCIGGG